MTQRSAGYRWMFGDLRTGKITRTVDLTDATWSLPFDGPGSMEGKFPLRSGEWPTARADAAVAKSFIAVAYVAEDGSETFIEAGPLWKTTYNRSTGELTLGGAGLWTYFDHRKLLPVLNDSQSAATVSLSYQGSLALIAKRLVEAAQAHTEGTLPIVFPDDAALGTRADHERTYPGYELGWVGERLSQITDVEGGPEVQFVPRRRVDDPRYIEWVMRIGTEAPFVVEPPDEGGPTPVTLETRVASFNYQGLSSASNFASRFDDIVENMFEVGAAVIGAQEADSARTPNQALKVRNALNAYPGSSGQWQALIGRNLNVFFIDRAEITPLWSQVRNFHLGNNKYLVVLLAKDEAGGGEALFCNTHYLTSNKLDEQISATVIALRVLKDLAAEFPGVPQVLMGDFNAKDEADNRPMGMFTDAGHTDVRTLVAPGTVVNGTYNSHNKYGTPNGMNGWWIDQIRVRYGITPTLVGLHDTGEASDHNIVYADLVHSTTTGPGEAPEVERPPLDRLIYRPGAPHLFDSAAPESPLRELTITAEGSAMAQRVWAAGQGEAEGRPIVQVEDDSLLLSYGYPLLEAEVGATDTVEQAGTLQAHAAEALAWSSRPVETWQIAVSRDDRRHVGMIRPGDWARLRITDDHYQPDGEYQMRILSMSGGDEVVTLGLAPRLGSL